MGHWLYQSRWILPALLLCLLALLVREELWQQQGLVSGGHRARNIPGYFILLATGLLTLMHGLSHSQWAFALLPRSFGMRKVSAVEEGCALVLTRGVILLSFYAIAYLAWTHP